VIGGTGALGKALAIRLAAAGHEVWIGSRDAARAQAAAEDVMAGVGGRVQGAAYADAAAAAEICFLAVPYAAHVETIEQVKGAVQGKIFVDTTAPLKPPKVGTVQLPPSGAAAVEAAQALGPEVRVVSALQTIGAEKLAAGGAIDADVLVAADDAEAAAVVRGLLLEMGLRSWHVGPLANSAAAEAMTSVLIQINRRYKLGQAGVRITGASKGLTVTPVTGLPMFEPGQDLAGAIAEALVAAGERLVDGDVVVVAQKAVSKVEGRVVRLADVEPSARAIELAGPDGDPRQVETILRESVDVVRSRPPLVIAETRHGFVCASAGVDASNTPAEDTVVLLPLDPDASARRLRERLVALAAVDVGVIVSDSFGRAWRQGTTDVALGVAGITPLLDLRGTADARGRELGTTQIAVADEIAAAAELVLGKARSVPAAIVRGVDVRGDGSAAELVMPRERDLFR